MEMMIILGLVIWGVIHNYVEIIDILVLMIPSILLVLPYENVRNSRILGIFLAFLLPTRTRLKDAPVNPDERLQAVNPDEPLQLNDKPASTISGALDRDYSVNLAGNKAASTWDIDFDHSNPYFPPIIDDDYSPLNPFNPNPDVILQ